jgi:hypothetical protein
MRFYDGSKRWWIIVSVFVAIVVALVWADSLGRRQRRDKAAVQEYMSRIQPQLLADPRFKKVEILGYSCDSIRYPYMPIFGSVRNGS